MPTGVDVSERGGDHRAMADLGALDGRSTLSTVLRRAGLAIALTAALAGCTTFDHRHDGWPRGDGDPPAAATPTTVAPKSGDPIPAELSGRGADTCRELAKGPWATLLHGTDPVADVAEGRIPGVPTGSRADDPPDSERTFTSVDEYRDPSSMVDVGALREVMIDAGFVEGRDVRWGTRHRLALVSVNRYRDADAAKDVLTAHLTALCGEATSVEVRDDRAGLTIVRESDTVRTVFVLDDVEVSVMICHCYGSDNDSRRAIIDEWSSQVKGELQNRDPQGDDA